MVGSIYASLLGYLLFEAHTVGVGVGVGVDVDWRVFNVACSVPVLVAAVSVYMWVPEAPGFQYLSLGDVTGDHPSHQSHQSQQTNTTHAPHALRTLYTLYKTTNTLSLQILWFSLSFSSYGILTTITPLFDAIGLKDAYLITLVFTLAALVANVTTYALIDNFDKTRFLLLALLLSSPSTILFGTLTTTLPIIAAACAFQITTTIAWNLLDCLTPLQYTAKQTAGFGMCSAAGRLGAFVAQGVNGYLLKRSVKALLVVDGVVLMVACLVARSGVKKGVKREDEDEDEDGEEEKEEFIIQF
jgi:hypothetical protein